MLKIKYVCYLDIKLKSIKPFFPVKTIKRSSFLIATSRDLHIYAYSDTMDGLRKEVCEQIGVMWLEFVLNPRNDILSLDAQILKCNLLKNFTLME